jgi:hypothetical protein
MRSTYARVADDHTKFQLVMPVTYREALDRMAERDGVTVSEIMRRAIAFYCPIDILAETIEKP